MGTHAGHSTGGEHPAIVPVTGVCGFIDLEPTRAKISVGKRGRVHRNQAIVRTGAQHIVFNPLFDEMEHLEICAKEIMPHL